MSMNTLSEICTTHEIIAIENNIFVKPEIEISNMDLLIEFAKIGLGVTVVIKDFIKKELEDGSLVEVPIKPRIPKREIGIVSNKKLSLSVAGQAFKSFIENSNFNKDLNE